MNRTTAAALVSLAVVGTIGGGVSAVVRGAAPEAPPAPSSGSDEPAAEVLYAGGGVIHDGARTIRYDAAFDTPDRLVRTADGYLVTTDTGGDRSSAALFTVSADGVTKHLADVLGRWDLDPAGERVTHVERSGRLAVRDLTGTVQARWNPPARAQSPVWTAHGTVLVGVQSEPAQAPVLWEWDPDARRADQLDRSALPDATASRDGTLFTGSVSIDGYAVPHENVCMAVRSVPPAGQVQWHTCDWRANNRDLDPFSPDAERILAVTAESDGFGPSGLATFSATRGPSEGMRTFDTPELTMDAVWLDEDHLLLQGATDQNLDANTGSWVEVCDLEGTCTREATRKRGELVLGEQG